MARRKSSSPKQKAPAPAPAPAAGVSHRVIGGVIAVAALAAIAAFFLLGRKAAPIANPPSTHATPFSQPVLAHTLDHGDYDQPVFRPGADEILFLHCPQTGGNRPHLTAVNCDTGEQVADLETSARLTRLTVSPDGRTAAVAENDGGIDLVAVQGLVPGNTLPGHSVTPADLCFSPDSTRLLSVAAGEDSTATVWDPVARTAILHTPKLDSPPLNGCWLPGGGQIFVWGKNHAGLIWDLATRKELRQLLHPGGVLRAAVSPDGQWIVIGSGGLDFFNARTGELIKREEDTDRAWPHPVAISPDSKWVAEVIPNQNLIHLWRLNPIEIAATFHQPAPGTGVEFSANSSYLLSRAQNGALQIFDCSDATEVCQLPGPAGRDGLAHLSADGRWLVATGTGGAKIWKFTAAGK